MSLDKEYIRKQEQLERDLSDLLTEYGSIVQRVGVSREPGVEGWEITNLLGQLGIYLAQLHKSQFPVAELTKSIGTRDTPGHRQGPAPCPKNGWVLSIDGVEKYFIHTYNKQQGEPVYGMGGLHPTERPPPSFKSWVYGIDEYGKLVDVPGNYQSVAVKGPRRLEVAQKAAVRVFELYLANEGFELVPNYIREMQAALKADVTFEGEE